MLLQRLEKETEAANLVHRNAAHRKAISKVKGKRELKGDSFLFFDYITEVVVGSLQCQ